MIRRSLIAAFAITTASCAGAQDFDRGSRNTAFAPAFPQQFRAPLRSSDIAMRREVVARGLEHPWGIEVLPDAAGYLVTERAGRLRHISREGEVGAPIKGIPRVLARDQGGLLDVALAPDFATSRRVYLTYAKPLGGGLSATAAAHGRLSADLTALEGVQDIFVQEPGSTIAKHYGSRVVFDGAGHVYVTTGEHSSPQTRVYAQDLDKTYGKVVRITPEGRVPQGNPFAGRTDALATIWSYGHRNIQGAMMRDGTLWTIEHGPRGGDELNRIEAGANYGWPVVSYGKNYDGTPVGSGEPRAEGMAEPVYFWDPVIAPGGMLTYDGAAFAGWAGDILIGSLNPGGIVRLDLANGRVTGEERLRTDLGRVRDLAVDADGALLALTDFANGQLVRIAPGS